MRSAPVTIHHFKTRARSSYAHSNTQGWLLPCKPNNLDEGKLHPLLVLPFVLGNSFEDVGQASYCLVLHQGEVSGQLPGSVLRLLQAPLARQDTVRHSHLDHPAF